MLNFFRVVLVAAAVLNAGGAQAEPDQAVDLPTQYPFLRIDAGMHTAPIRRIGVDASCTLLATASEDKTIRLWRLPEGKLLSTLRPPIGDGNEGKVYAVAVAPDGAWVAAGGWTRTGGDHWIYIFQTATGAMATRLGPFRQVITNLVVSPDGRNLAATFWRGGGVHVWEREGAGLSDWKPVGEDAVYGGRDANGAAFAETGALYTVADDGQLRRYAPNDFAARPKIAPTPGGKRPNSISINPKNNELAVGFADTALVEIYDPTTLSYLFAAKGGEASGAGGLSATAWSANGERLFAGGIYAKDEQHVIRIWDDARHGSPHDLEGSADAIMSFLPCSDGVAVGASDPAFGLLDARGVRRLWRGPIGADMRNKLDKNFTVSADGMRVRFGLGEGGDDPFLFDLNMQHLIPSPRPLDDLFPPATSTLPIEGWRNTPKPKLAAEEIGLDRNERSQSLAITSDRQRFVLGCDYYLRAYDKDGGLLWKPKQAPGVFWGVNVSQDGRLIVAAAGDGTVRWYRVDNGHELLALFVQRETREWVAWTPEGYFMASPRGAELVGWHVNRGWAQSADFFALSRFRDTFDRPDVVKRVLATLDGDTAIREANALIKKTRENDDITKSLPPVIAITSSKIEPSGSSPGPKDVVIEYKVRSPSRLPVTRVVARVDSRPAAGGEAANLTLDSNGEATGTFTVHVGPRDTAISLIAESNDLAGTPAVLTVGPVQDGGQDTIKPKLYALLVAVGEYAKVHPKLSPIPENDADLLAKELSTQKGNGGAFADVDIKLLKDVDATHANILDWLQEVAQKAKDPVSDIALVYFSGHGAVDKTGAFLLPSDFDPDHSFKTGLYKRDILAFLKSIPGRVIFIVDACHAAADLEGTELLNSNAIVGEFSEQRNGITTFASSQGAELSGAAPGAANSYFTRALVDGLHGRAARLGERIILTVDLPPWLSREVPKLSGNKQTPIMIEPLWGRPPPLAAVSR